MVVPGLQISEILAAIDNSIKLGIKINEAPLEIGRILNSIDHATLVLKEWEAILEEFNDQISPAQRELLDSTTIQYENVLTQLTNFKKKHGGLIDGKWTGRVRYVVSEHFKAQCEPLEKLLDTMEGRIRTVMHMNSWKQTCRLERNNSLISMRYGTATIIPHTSTTLEHVSVRPSHSSQEMVQVFSELVPFAEPESYLSPSASLSNFLPTMPPSPGSPTGQLRSEFLATSENGDSASLRSQARSESTSDRTSVFSVFSSNTSARTSLATQYTIDTPPSPLPTGMLSMQAPMRDIGQVGVQAQPGPNLSGYSLSGQSPSANPQNVYQGSPGSISMSSSNTPPSSPPPVSPARTFVSPMKHQMTIHGEVRVWCAMKKSYVVKNMEIVNDNKTGASIVYMKTAERLNLQHRRFSTTPTLAQSMLRPKVPSEITIDHPTITCFLQFDGHNILSARKKDKIYKMFFEGALNYTFTDNRDNLSFQSHIMGRELLSEDLIKSFTISSRKHPLCENLYLQIWRSPTSQSLRFYCNMDPSKMFWEHDTRPLRRFCSEDEIKKKGKWEREMNLRVISESGLREKSPEVIKILFAPGVDKVAWAKKAAISMENI